MGRMCLINDCTGFAGLAPCCLDCPDRQRCPDRCPKTETTFCIGVIEDDGKRVFDQIQGRSEGSQGD